MMMMQTHVWNSRIPGITVGQNSCYFMVQTEHTGTQISTESKCERKQKMFSKS